MTTTKPLGKQNVTITVRTLLDQASHILGEEQQLLSGHLRQPFSFQTLFYVQ